MVDSTAEPPAGQTVLVTGATGGIGRSLVETRWSSLAGQGWHLAVGYALEDRAARTGCERPWRRIAPPRNSLP